MKKTALVLGLAVVLSFFVVGCTLQQSKTAPVYYTFPGADGRANSYILANGNQAAVIDPSNTPAIIKKLKDMSLNPEYIILTHGHFDHIAGIDAVKKEFPKAQVMIHPIDMDKLTDPAKNLSVMVGQSVVVNSQASPLIDGQSIQLANINITVIATPGHSPGSICLSAGDLLFTGDTLFRGSVGRTDFPDSGTKELQLSLHKLDKLPAETRVLPGHGDATTLGEERQ